MEDDAAAEVNAENLAKLVALIKMEANEKLEEIEVMSEEAVKLEKARIYRRACQEIEKEYEQKEASLMCHIRREISHMKIQHHLKFLWAQRRVFDGVKEGVMEALRLNLKENPKEYLDLLVKLLLQAISRLDESKVLVSVRKIDLGLMDEVVGRVRDEYQKTGRKCQMYRHREYLPPKSMGGVEVLTMDGRAKVCNTVYDQFMFKWEANEPELKKLLFPPSQVWDSSLFSPAWTSMILSFLKPSL